MVTRTKAKADPPEQKKKGELTATPIVDVQLSNCGVTVKSKGGLGARKKLSPFNKFMVRF